MEGSSTASLQCEAARVISGIQTERNSCHNMSTCTVFLQNEFFGAASDCQL